MEFPNRDDGSALMQFSCPQTTRAAGFPCTCLAIFDRKFSHSHHCFHLALTRDRATPRSNFTMSSSTTTTTSTARPELAVSCTRACEPHEPLQQDSGNTEYEVEEFLTHNGSPTGNEPVNNPHTWPTNQRRVPPYRAPVVNPAWSQIAGDNMVVRTFMWTMLSGCQLLQVG
jgi:hypothetical protein